MEIKLLISTYSHFFFFLFLFFSCCCCCCCCFVLRRRLLIKRAQIISKTNTKRGHKPENRKDDKRRKFKGIRSEQSVPEKVVHDDNEDVNRTGKYENKVAKHSNSIQSSTGDCSPVWRHRGRKMMRNKVGKQQGKEGQGHIGEKSSQQQHFWC